LAGRMSGIGTFRTWRDVRHESVIRTKAVVHALACGLMPQNGKLLNNLNLICPVQFDFQKYFRSAPQIKSISLAVPSHRGAARDRHERGAGCGGRGRRCRRAALTRTAKSCGPDAPTLASSSRKATFADDGGKQARSPGRARRKPLKPLRRECRVFPV
jgi:hypothetical protein